MPPSDRSMAVVVGATGNVGSRVLRRLMEAGTPTVAVARDPARLPAAPAGHPLVRAMAGDLATPSEALLHVISGAGVVFFCAAPRLTADCLAAVKAAGLAMPKRSIALSSARVHSRHDGDGTRSATRAAEADLRSLSEATGAAVVVLRPTMIWGGGRDLNVTRLRQSVARRRVVPLPGGGRALVQPIHAEDVAQAMLAAAAAPAPWGSHAVRHAALDTGGATTLPFRELIALLAREEGRRPPIIVSIPGGLARLAARLAELLRLRRPGVLTDAIGRMLENRTVDNGPTLRALPEWRPEELAAHLARERSA